MPSPSPKPIAFHGMDLTDRGRHTRQRRGRLVSSGLYVGLFALREAGNRKGSQRNAPRFALGLVATHQCPSQSASNENTPTHPYPCLQLPANPVDCRARPPATVPRTATPPTPPPACYLPSATAQLQLAPTPMVPATRLLTGIERRPMLSPSLRATCPTDAMKLVGQ